MRYDWGVRYTRKEGAHGWLKGEVCKEYLGAITEEVRGLREECQPEGREIFERYLKTHIPNLARTRVFAVHAPNDTVSSCEDVESASSRT